ncbi:hypothetical protein DFH07DRAFT_967743 [Mycena maculata]|uniref:Uncharacterized protein n=1 Tax=Mycena maculata TaxID=230809 RepID=A0AAD7I3K9_9AGAR|nr:hypothetical protein DFH07DRAFT_967743 [Mycena maculata]
MRAIDFPAVATEAFASCKELEVLVDMHVVGQYFGDLLHVDDPRFVHIFLTYDGHPADWFVGTRGGLDYWAVPKHSSRAPHPNQARFALLDIAGGWDLK